MTSEKKNIAKNVNRENRYNIFLIFQIMCQVNNKLKKYYGLFIYEITCRYRVIILYIDSF